jgi:hypothetical protein
MAEISGMVPTGTAVTVLCCLCGTRTTTPPFCADCLKGQADLAEEVKPTGEDPSPWLLYVSLL